MPAGRFGPVVGEGIMAGGFERRAAALVAAFLITGASAAGAQTLRSDDPGFLSFAAGAFDFLHDRTAGEFRGEYRSGERLLGFLKPFVGLMGTTDSAFYGYGGFLADIYFGDRWVLTPNVALGYYDRGDGKDLGSLLEFRTGAEFAYRFDDRSRIGLAFNHISNAGIDKRNPGEESLVLVYSIPFSLFK
jgi:lipid A 3-O-deacylase